MQKFCPKIWEETLAKNTKVEDFLHFISSGNAFEDFSHSKFSDGWVGGWMDDWI